MIRKNPAVDLKLKYKKVFEICLIISLFLVIAAFRFIPEIKGESLMSDASKPFFKVMDVPDTGVPPVPPPPPPKVSISEVLLDDDMEDILIEDTDWDENEDVLKTTFEEEEDDVDYNSSHFIAVVEVMPEPIGGIKAIQEKIIYPELAKRALIQGTVYIKAFVDKNGIVKKVELIKGIGLGCDKEAINAVLSTKFKPGKQRGRAVNVQVSIPIRFKIN